MNTPFSFSAVGTITTPFKQKFAIPRQPNLARAKGQIHLHPDYADPQVFKGIEGFSHLWLLFVFHQTMERGWKPAIKAPRLGGNATLGVFASRSTHRPNPVGMSVVENHGVEIINGQPVLNVCGVDLLCDTPIIDIKPYIRYADSIEASDNLERYAPIPHRPVSFSEQGLSQLHQHRQRHPDLAALITAVLQQDPRPAYRHKNPDDEKVYQVLLYDLDIAWQVRESAIIVHAIELA